MYSNASPKFKSRKKVIGNKGTGFRSILSWADEVTIDSGKLHISFSDKYSQKILKEGAKKHNIKLDGSEKAATLVFPKWNRQHEKSEYTTTIKIKIKNDENVINDIKRQLDSLFGETLLFLNRTKKLILTSDRWEISEWIYEKRIISESEIEIISYESGKKTQTDIWVVSSLSKNINVEEEEQTFSASVAYRKDGLEPNNPVLYSYFATEEGFPYSFLTLLNLVQHSKVPQLKNLLRMQEWILKS